MVVEGRTRGVRANDNWGWTDPVTGREYALVGRNDGTSFIDISNPTNPMLVGDLPKPWGTHYKRIGSSHNIAINEETGFGGAWSNYPYFESGTVIVTSMQEGLFVLKKRVRPVS